MTETAVAPNEPVTEAVSTAGRPPEDEVLDRIFGKEEKPDGDETKEQPEAKASGDESTEGGEPESEKDADEPAEEETAGDERAAKKEALEKAINTLRQRKVPQTVLKKMSNAEILDMAGSEQEFITSMANAKREAAELRKQVESKQTKVEPEPSSGVPAEPLDVSALVEPLTELFGEDGAGAFAKVFGGAATNVLGAVDAKLSEADKRVDRVEGWTRELLYAYGRQQLGERFPGLKEDAKFAKFKARCERQTKADWDEGPFAVMENAARIEFYDAAQSRSSAHKDARDTGQPSRPRGGPKSKPMTPQEREEKVLDIIEGGGTAADVIAQLGS